MKLKKTLVTFKFGLILLLKLFSFPSKSHQNASEHSNFAKICGLPASRTAGRHGGEGKDLSRSLPLSRPEIFSNSYLQIILLEICGMKHIVVFVYDFFTHFHCSDYMRIFEFLNYKNFKNNQKFFWDLWPSVNPEGSFQKLWFCFNTPWRGRNAKYLIVLGKNQCFSCSKCICASGVRPLSRKLWKIENRSKRFFEFSLKMTSYKGPWNWSTFALYFYK